MILCRTQILLTRTAGAALRDFASSMWRYQPREDSDLENKAYVGGLTLSPFMLSYRN